MYIYMLIICNILVIFESLSITSQSNIYVRCTRNFQKCFFVYRYSVERHFDLYVLDS